MNKWLIVWNIVLTVLLLAAILNGCSAYDPRYDSVYSQVETNRQNIVKIAEGMEGSINLMQMQAEAIEKSLNLVQVQFETNLEYIQQNRQAIIQIGDIVQQQSEYLNQQTSDLNNLKLLLQILSAL